jgi:uncharacterized membrane-anchored protein
LTSWIAGCSSESTQEAAESADDSGATSQYQDCSDGVRVISAFENFPSESQLEQALEQRKETVTASLQVAIENTIEQPVSYEMTVSFNTITRSERVRQTPTRGSLEPGATESFTFEISDDPRYMESYRDHTISIQSSC